MMFLITPRKVVIKFNHARGGKESAAATLYNINAFNVYIIIEYVCRISRRITKCLKFHGANNSKIKSSVNCLLVDVCMCVSLYTII